MDKIQLFLISVGLAMDAFAVAICKGLSMKKTNIKKSLIIGVWFGTFQAVMPVIGYFLGNTFKTTISSVDYLISFILLSFIGIKMLKDAFENENSSFDDSICVKVMFFLALATSIDALTIGITFIFLNVNILIAASVIGVITFAMAVCGVIIGNKFGNKYEKRAQALGGIILIYLGIQNLLEHFAISN